MYYDWKVGRTKPVKFNKSGAGDVSGAKSTGSSSENPGPTSCMAVQNQLELQCQGIQHSLLTTLGTAHTHVAHTYTQTKYINKFRKPFVIK